MSVICDLCGKDMEPHAPLLGIHPSVLLRYHKEVAHHIRLARPENDKAIVALVDELVYHLKTTPEASGEPCRWTPIRKSLRKHLESFVVENKLDGDSHRFASLPEEP